MFKKLFLTIAVVIVLNATGIDCKKLKPLNLYKGDINSQQAYEMQQKGVLIVDIRTKAEFRYLHSKGAKLIPAWFNKNGKGVWNENFVEQLKYALDGDINKPVVIICRSGSRTKCAANYLSNMGFTNVYNVKHGFAYDWLKVKLPVSK